MGTGASACPACPRQPPAKATIYKAVSGARHAGSQRSVLAGREGGREAGKQGGSATGKGGSTGPERSPDGKPGQAPPGGLPAHAHSTLQLPEGFSFLCCFHCTCITPGGPDRASSTTAGEADAQRGEALCTKSHSKPMAKREARTRGGGGPKYVFCCPDKPPAPPQILPRSVWANSHPEFLLLCWKGPQELLWDCNFPELRRSPT